jgi:membrane-bound acyltransferase YfiQ involved in biofilm formation
MNLSIESVRLTLVGVILIILFILGTYFRSKRENQAYQNLGTLVYFIAMLNGVVLVTIDYFIQRLGLNTFIYALTLLLLIDGYLLFYIASKLNGKNKPGKR